MGSRIEMVKMRSRREVVKMGSRRAMAKIGSWRQVDKMGSSLYSKKKKKKRWEVGHKKQVYVGKVRSSDTNGQ